jgi:hypothetical protein
VALYRLIARPSLFTSLAFAALLTGCQEQRPNGQAASQPVVEVMPATKATADVDRRATLALKQDLLTRFPQKSLGAAVETTLSEDGFACGPNPTAPTERACLKVVRSGVCEVNTIIRTTPYTPDKAQVIKICETGAPASAP